MLKITNSNVENYLESLTLNYYTSLKFEEETSQSNNTKIDLNKNIQLNNIYLSLNPKFTGLKEDITEFQNNPYVKNIKLSQYEKYNIKLDYVYIPADTLIITDTFVNPDEEFIFYKKLGYFDKKLKVPVLLENNQVWMSPTLLEQRSMKEPLAKMKGNVLILGLGIGYFAYMSLLKEEVNEITIIERNQHIIDYFNLYIKPQFPKNKNINIINEDAHKYLRRSNLNIYDSIFIDTYLALSDGTVEFLEINSYNISHNNMCFWIESQIKQNIKNITLLYLNLIKQTRFTEVLNQSDKYTSYLLKYIHKYVRRNNINLNDLTEVKNLLNSEIYK